MALYTVSISKSAASSSGTEVKIVPTLPSGSGTSVSIGSDNAPDTVTIGSGSGSQDAYTVSISNAATDTANASVSIGSDNAPSTVSIGGGSTLVSATVGVGRGPAGPQGVAGNNGTDGTNGTDGLGFTGGSYAASTGVVTFTSNDGLGFATGDLRGNVDLSSPDPIGDVAPNTGAFTSLTATSYSGDGSGLTGLATSAQGALADSATQPADLATVATTGGYSDLTGLPTLGTAAATASTDYATAAQGALADDAVQPNDSPTFGDGTFTGNVGIGTTSPSSTLHVNSGGTNNVATFESTDGTASVKFVDSNQTTNVVLGAKGDDFYIQAGGNEKLRVLDSGNVGIGKTNPATALDVSGTVTATAFAGDGSALTGISSPTIVRSTAFASPSSYRYSFAHGQGAVPDLVWAELKVLTAQHGYAVGASVKVNNILELDETDFVMTLSGTSTTLNFAANNPSIIRYVGRNDINTAAEAVFAAGSIELYLVGVWF